MSQTPQPAGPRITMADIEASIVSESYFTAAQGCVGNHFDRTSLDLLDDLGMVTCCALILRNGTKIVGVNYGAIDPRQHNAEMGRKEARAHAIEQIWPLVGFELRSKLMAALTQGADATPADQPYGATIAKPESWGGGAHRADQFDTSGQPTMANPLHAFQDRVRIEAAELNKRIMKLKAFTVTDTFGGLPKDEQDRMHAQLAAMYDYSNCLSERIRAFGK